MRQQAQRKRGRAYRRPRQLARLEGEGEAERSRGEGHRNGEACHAVNIAEGTIKCGKPGVKLGKGRRSSATGGYHPRMSAQVLLADDDAELGAMLKEYLEREGFGVTVVHDGEAAARQALSGTHQIVVLDVMMPRLDGVEALRRIRQSSLPVNRIPVIMLTARGDDVDRILGLELGADDYVPKPCTPRELVARLRAILRRLQPAPGSGPLQAGALVLWPERRKAEVGARELELTSIEFNILEVLMRNAGRLVSKSEISEQALGRPLARFDRSIDVHMSSIRHKLGDAARLIRTVRGLGYHLVKD